jgi:hypothetical protein
MSGLERIRHRTEEPHTHTARAVPIGTVRLAKLEKLGFRLPVRNGFPWLVAAASTSDNKYDVAASSIGA